MRGHEDEAAEAFLTGRREEGEGDGRAALRTALREATEQSPPAAVEERHLDAIVAAAAEAAAAPPGGASRAGAVGLPRRRRPLAVAVKFAAVLAATMVAATALAVAGVGLPDAARGALEDVGVALPGEGPLERKARPTPPPALKADPNPAFRCARERREDPDRFAQRYDRRGRHGAFGACVAGRGADNGGARAKASGKPRPRSSASRRARARNGRASRRSRAATSPARRAGAPRAAAGAERARRARRAAPSTQRGSDQGGRPSNRGRPSSAGGGRPSFAGPPPGAQSEDGDGSSPRARPGGGPGGER